MDRGTRINQFLVSRRARVTPQDVGLLDGIGQRRVPGLRREEVAQLAGVSTEYYIRLERGRITSMSASVLNAVAAALRLDDAERQHLFDLVGPETSTRRAGTRPVGRARPSLLRLLEVMSEVPAMIQNHRTDVLAANDLGRALYPYVTGARAQRSDVTAGEATGIAVGGAAGGAAGSATGNVAGNIARFVYLDPRAEVFYANWEQSARDSVAMLQLASGHHGEDGQLNQLIGELSVKSLHFRRLWAEHDVRHHTTGVKTLHHPLVGDLTLTYESLRIGDSDHTLVTYTAQAGSLSQESLALLGSWSASERQATLRTDQDQDTPA